MQNFTINPRRYLTADEENSIIVSALKTVICGATHTDTTATSSSSPMMSLCAHPMEVCQKAKTNFPESDYKQREEEERRPAVGVIKQEWKFHGGR
ncbi:hypothetical protein L6452_41266 [Arctium lappa]|uniref:Uncharacterized protein n=2 Tax=Arctium lappa TaxID=4217 RepID=A0ACB8XP81_ARCLA|nr:hypothetical protein L6452_41265 [Arctium lappa]KAI3669837.1 hypothetical protein L6452_41266 [Arctium lappa]